MFEVVDTDGNGNEEKVLPLHFTKGFDNEAIELRYNEDLNALEYYQSFTVASDDASSNLDEVNPKEDKQLNRLQLKVDMTYVMNQIDSKHQDNIQFDSKYKLLNKSIDNINGTQMLFDITKHCAFGDQFLPCMATNIIDDIYSLSVVKQEMQNYIDSISGRLRNYTCIDESMQTSSPIYTYNTTLQYRGMDREYEVNVLLDKNHSKIWTVDNFVSKEECDVFIEHGTPKLQRAAVVDEYGAGIVSENRKANQADYYFSGPISEDPLSELYQRVLNMTNTHTGFSLERAGQNGFSIIQYAVNDQYT